MRKLHSTLKTGFRKMCNNSEWYWYEKIAMAIAAVTGIGSAVFFSACTPEPASLHITQEAARHLTADPTIGVLLHHPALAGFAEHSRPVTVVFMYTGRSAYTPDDPPAFIGVGENDGIANSNTMKRRADALTALGIDTEFH